MSDVIAYRVENGYLYADVYSNGLFPDAVPATSNSFAYQWVVDGVLDVAATSNSIQLLSGHTYQIKLSGTLSPFSFLNTPQTVTALGFVASTLNSQYVGVPSVTLDINDLTSYYTINNLPSVDNFISKVLSGKFQINGGDLTDWVDFSSYSTATTGIYLVPGANNGLYTSVYEVLLGTSTGANLGPS